MWRHCRARNAGRDDTSQVLLRSGMAEFSAPEIDVGYQVAVDPMAGDAVRGVDSRAPFDIGKTVLAGVLLGRKGNDPKNPRGPRQGGQHSLKHRAKDST